MFDLQASWHARQVVDGKLTAGELSTFVIYALYVGSNVGALAGVISNLIQVSAAKRLRIGPATDSCIVEEEHPRSVHATQGGGPGLHAAVLVSQQCQRGGQGMGIHVCAAA